MLAGKEGLHNTKFNEKCRLARAVALCRKHSCEPTCRRRKHETKDTRAAFGVIVWTLDYRLSTPQTSEIVNSISSFDCSDRCKAYGLTDAHESLQLFCNPPSQINCGVSIGHLPGAKSCMKSEKFPTILRPHNF